MKNKTQNSLIAFAGRKESGKTELAKICENYGYNLISFATPLKQLISELLGCTITELNQMKNADITYSFDQNDCKHIANVTQIPLDVVTNSILNKKFRTTRHIMQFFGTDLIRKNNPDWHVNELEKIISLKEKYVIDDVRFPNESNLIRKLNGDIWFIIRNKYDNISNHISENSLKWYNFDKVIINDSTLNEFINTWDCFIKHDYDTNVNRRMSLLDKFTLKKVINITPFLLEEMKKLLLHADQFTYSPYFQNNQDISNVIVNNNDLIVELQNGTKLNVENIFMKEDLKLYINI